MLARAEPALAGGEAQGLRLVPRVIAQLLGAQVALLRGHLFNLIPVAMACGIGLWLSLEVEPVTEVYAATLAVGAAGSAFGWKGPELLRPIGVGLACAALGFCLIGWRSAQVAGPVLQFRYFGPVEGRIVMIDRSQSDVLRLTLDRVVLESVSPERTPRRVRVSLHGEQGFVTPEPGLRVMMTAHLSRPDGAVEPGGFDFQRMAWFRGIGAWGYTRTPVLARAPPEPGEARITRLRMAISAAVQARVAGDPGGFAAAVLTGDRSAISREAVQDLRDSNHAHLLAISGLHMGLLTGFVFVTVRMGLAMVPLLVLRLPTKKLAAVVALGAAAFYLALSGGNVAAERAFVMVSVMLGAALLDRKAISLRSVALAAIIVLAIQPEALAEPGFQMSFAATAALVAAFGALRGRWSIYRLPQWGQPIATLVVSSLIAGLATAPVAAVHFGRLAGYGLIANLGAVPLMGSVVIPSGVIAGLLAPVGLEAVPLWFMEQGTRWILFVAAQVAALDGAVRLVPTPAAWVLPVLGLSGVWMVLVRGRARAFLLAPMLVAGVMWQGEGRPPLMISADGGLSGLLGSEGRVLSAPRGNSFAAGIWLEGDGDSVTQAEAAARPGMDGQAGARRFALGEHRFAHLTGRGALDRLDVVCSEVDVVIISAAVPERAGRPCRIIDTTQLAQTGALALRLDRAGQLQAEPARKGARAWSTGPRQVPGGS